MKKLIILSVFIFLSILCVHSQTLTLGLGNADFPFMEYRVDTVANFKVGPGTQYVALRITGVQNSTHDQNVFFLIADLTNPHLEIRQVLSRDSLYGTERTTVAARRKSTPGAFYFAGTNGDFFDTSAAFPAGFNGRPVGGNMVNSEIAHTPNNRRVFAVDEREIPDIGLMSYRGSVTFNDSTHRINSVNHTRGTDALVLFNQYQGRVTKTNQHGTEVLIELINGSIWGVNRTLQARVLEIETNRGNMWIPAGKAVLSGHGSSRDWLNQLSVGDEVEISFELVMNGNAWDWAHMTGGDNRRPMLHSGVLETEVAQVWNERHPRTGIGFSVTRDTLIMAVVDGRSAVSSGVTTLHLAQLMQTAGAWSALNLDGGGSSTIFAEPFGQLNVPSDGSERASGNHVFLVATAPEDDEIGIIKSHTPVLELPVHGEFVPQFFGYNQYGILLDPDLQGVTLSVPSSLGTIVGNKFVAGSNTESGLITATYNGVTTEIRVNFIPVLDVSIRLDSVIVDNRTNYTIEVMATTARGESPISPLALHWTVENEEICEVVDGSIRALSNGRTLVIGEIDGRIDTLIVHVEIPESPVLIADKMELGAWEMRRASQYTDARFSQENLPQSWEHGAAVNFTHRAGVAPFIRLINSIPFYGLPDTVRIVLNIGDMAVNTADITLRANNETRTVFARFDSFEANQDFSLDIALDDLFDTSDRGIYPIWFDNMNFALRAASMTAGQAYALAIKEIQLIYAGLLQTNIPIIRDCSLPSFFVFPNPSADRVLYLQLRENHSQSVRTEIYNLQGQLIMQDFHGVNSGAPIQLSIQHLSSGAYLIQVFENDKNAGAMQFIVK